MGAKISGQSMWGNDAETLPVLFPANEDLAKAWINFNGTTIDGFENLIGVRDSFNVSHILDVGPGDHRIFWEVDFADDYCIVGMNAQTALERATLYIVQLSVDQVRIQVEETTASAVNKDSTIVCLAAFGAQ